MDTRVVNIKMEKSYDIYIGRRNRNGNDNHCFGNPFKVGAHGSREKVIKMFEEWLRGKNFRNINQEQRRYILSNLHKLRGKVLGCFCKPLSCHGDVLVKLLEERKRRRKNKRKRRVLWKS